MEIRTTVDIEAMADRLARFGDPESVTDAEVEALILDVARTGGAIARIRDALITATRAKMASAYHSPVSAEIRHMLAEARGNDAIQLVAVLVDPDHRSSLEVGVYDMSGDGVFLVYLDRVYVEVTPRPETQGPAILMRTNESTVDLVERVANILEKNDGK